MEPSQLPRFLEVFLYLVGGLVIHQVLIHLLWKPFDLDRDRSNCLQPLRVELFPCNLFSGIFVLVVSSLIYPTPPGNREAALRCPATGGTPCQFPRDPSSSQRS